MEQIEDLHVIVHHIIGLSLRSRIADHALAASSLRLPSEVALAYANPGG
jgi:hypothetical protein